MGWISRDSVIFAAVMLDSENWINIGIVGWEGDGREFASRGNFIESDVHKTGRNFPFWYSTADISNCIKMLMQ